MMLLINRYQRNGAKLICLIEGIDLLVYYISVFFVALERSV